METVCFILIAVLIAMIISHSVIITERNNLRNTVNKLTNDVFSQELKPYQYVLMYMGLYRRIDQELMEAKTITAQLWMRFKSSGTNSFVDYPSFVDYLKKQNIVSADYGKPIKFISLKELKEHGNSLKNFYNEAVIDL